MERPQRGLTLHFPHIWLDALSEVAATLSAYIEAHNTSYLIDLEDEPHEGLLAPSVLSDPRLAS